MPKASSNSQSCGANAVSSERDLAVLVVSREERATRAIRSHASLVAARVDHTDTAEDAMNVTRGLWYDVVIVDGALGDEAMAVCDGLRPGTGGPSVVVYAAEGTLDLATRAMRSGAFDLIRGECSRAEVRDRLMTAVRESSARRATAQREARLKRLCGKLDRARREVTGQVGELCTDLAGAYKDLSEQIGELAMTGELNGLLRQELDIENLLRTFLEYLLAQVGSTNAGVFLPGTLGDYSLGAYINYDQPKTTAEMNLEEMAGVLGPAFEDERRVVRLIRPSQVRSRLGEYSPFFEGQTVLAMGCFDRTEGEDAECLAVLCLFRDRRSPFSAQAVRTVQIAADLFGRQMSRVIRVHHRHMPEDFWLDDDDIDLAA